ncbi:MAG: SUMF1/EgtB/PvdO family nonheme iron enzyme [Planctomycetota bacterium]
MLILAARWRLVDLKREHQRVALAKAGAAHSLDLAAAKLGELCAQIEVERRLRLKVGSDEDELVYRSEAERSERRRPVRAARVRDAIGQRASEIQACLDAAERGDPTAARTAELRLELRWRMDRYAGFMTNVQEDERRIARARLAQRCVTSSTCPRTSITAEPADADLFLYRYLEQSEIRENGEPRLVPVPWARPRAPAWPADARCIPGDPCLLITAVEEGGVGAAAELVPGDLVLALNGRPAASGVWVTQVQEGGPAARMGLAVGDCLTGQGGYAICDLYDVSPLVLVFRFRDVPGNSLAWQSLTESGWVARTGKLASSADWLRTGGCLAGNLSDLLANGELGVDAELTVRHEGDVASVPWPAHTRLAITSQPTAYALLDESDARLGRSPLRDLELEPGSYLVVARRDGFDELRAPVRLTSRARPEPIHLAMKPSGTAPRDFVWIPPTSVELGDPDKEGGGLRVARLAGYWIARHELTVGEYFEFLNDPEVRARIDAGLAATPKVLDLLPREVRGTLFSELMLSTRLTTLEPDDLPVSGISQVDARAYCDWRSKRLRAQGWRGTVRLPSPDEWENAARGADARPWPFGGALDAALARLPGSRPEVSCKAPVGVFLGDESVYGLRDTTGNVMEWVSEDQEATGGYYGMLLPSSTRLSARHRIPRESTQPGLGFRLVWVPDASD